MTDTAKNARALVDHVLPKMMGGAEADEATVAMVLMVLDSHALLRDYDGTPAEYHERVSRAYADALRKMAGRWVDD